MSGGELSVDQLLTLLNKKVRYLSAFGTKYESTVSKPRPRSSFRFNDLDPATHQLSRVDVELRLTVNAIRPVNQLPAEILIEIFEFLHPRILHRYLPLVRATHVCRHWRNVISSTPGCWTWISTGWAELLPLSLQLSASAPIEVQVSSRDGFSPRFVDLLLPHCERVAFFTLAFSTVTRGHCSHIFNRLPCMPNLRMLSVIAEPGLTPCWFPILSGDMPYLESITLPFFSYGEQVVQLTHLTTIDITVECSALADVVGLFANNPELRSATLCGSFRDKSCQWKRGAVRMDSLRQLNLLSWSTTSLLPFFTLQKGAHIRVFGPASVLETVGAGGLFPSDTFLPNLVGLKQLHWYFTARDAHMEFTGPNGGFSILLPRPEVHVFDTDSFPVGEVEELYCEYRNTPGLVADTKELNRIVVGMVPAMSQLRKVTLAMCTIPVIQIILSNLNRTTRFKNITLSHCAHLDPAHDTSHALIMFAMDTKLEEIRMVCRETTQQTRIVARRLSKVVKSFALVYQSPLETRRTKFEIHRGFPASIRKTYPLVL